MTDYNPFSLSGKTILITGASSGIGRTAAIECSKLGATVFLTGRNENRLKETLDLLSGKGHNYIIADLSNDEQMDSLVSQLPLLDGVVCNAGINYTTPVPFITKEKLLDILTVNTVAPILLIKMLLKKKKLNTGASIVFTDSIAGVYNAAMGNSMYASSKSAIYGFVRNAALELAAKKIRVNMVNPGTIDTEMTKNSVFDEEQLKADMALYPLKRHGRPEEVAFALIYFLSDASSFTTGASLVVDGGFTLA